MVENAEKMGGLENMKKTGCNYLAIRLSIGWLDSKSIFTNCGNGWEFTKEMDLENECRKKDLIFSLGSSRLLCLVVGGGSN